MEHLNGHILCAIDTETTGLDPEWNELLEIAIIPLDWDLKPHSVFAPFDCMIQPYNPDRFDKGAIQTTGITIEDYIIKGVSPETAVSGFDSWYQKLNLAHNKRIVPLAHNWPFDREFIRKWLGTVTFQAYFDGQYRDTMVAAAFMNDRYYQNTDRQPFPKLNLQYLASCVNYRTNRAHRALEDAQTTAEVYRRMMTKAY